MPFQAGQSGNPGGRPKESAEVKRLAKEYTAEAIQRLADWMRSDNAKASVSACQALLDRGYGKPATTLIGDASEDPIQAAITSVGLVPLLALTHASSDSATTEADPGIPGQG